MKQPSSERAHPAAYVQYINTGLDHQASVLKILLNDTRTAMVGFRTTFHTTVTTAIPSDVDAKAVINAFHDHGFIITQQPIVTRYEMRDRDPATGKLTYDVFENISLLPFGLWVYELQFTSAFTDKRDGTVTWIEAPMGFTSEAEYTVKPSEQWNGEGGGWVLEEEIETTCPVVLKWFVEGTMVPVRQKMHEQIIDSVRQREKKERDREARRSEVSRASGGVERPPGNYI